MYEFAYDMDACMIKWRTRDKWTTYMYLTFDVSIFNTV